MVHLAIFGLLITDEMEHWHIGLRAQLMDKLALPEKHDVALHFDRLFYFSSEMLACLFLLHYFHKKRVIDRKVCTRS